MISSEFEVSNLALLRWTRLIINPTTRGMMKANFSKRLNVDSSKRQQRKITLPGDIRTFILAKSDIISCKTL